MRLDIERHRLLKLLSDKTVQFNIGNLPKNEAIGISFDSIMSKMKCDREKLELISSELYLNKEIEYHDYHDVVGLCCGNNGLTSFSNNKYLARYWKDFWSNLLTISQIIVPIMALGIALVTVLDSRQSKVNTEEILLLEKEIYSIREIQDSQTNTISNLANIQKTDSLTKKLK